MTSQHLIRPFLCVAVVVLLCAGPWPGSNSAVLPADAGTADYYLWLFDEAHGEVAVDSGTRGVDMTITAAAWQQTGPHPGAAALHLDGSGQTYAHFDRDISADQRTLEMWIRPTRLGGRQELFSTRYTSTSRFGIFLAEGDLVVSDQYWERRNDLVASGAFVEQDLDRWTHVAVSWGPEGYRLYKQGALLASNETRPFGNFADRGAVGLSAWDLSAHPFAGDVAEVRLSLEVLAPGQGTGVGELAWAASLAERRIRRPDLSWLPAALDGNVFAREPAILTLRVGNRYLEPLSGADLTVQLRDLFTTEDMPPLSVSTEGPVPPRGEVLVPVDLDLTRSSVYEVTALGPGGSRARTEATWIQGPPPEDYTGPAPFLGTNAHRYDYPWDFILRREFGSRLERTMIMWLDQTDPLQFQWLPENHPLLTVVPEYDGEVYGFSGYTPAYASPRAEEEKSIHDVPVLSYYRDWMEAACRHYRDHVRYWEVWNEPNADGTFFRGTAEQLADLHKTAFLAARRTAPGVKIIGASTVSLDLPYMDRLRDAGALDYMDVIAFHAYRWDYPPDAGLLKALQSMTRWRDEHAPGRPLWDNEFGYENHRWTARRHAEITGRHLILDKALGMQHAAVYTWRWAPHYLFNQVWPTPSAVAYRTVAQRLTNAVPVAALAEGEGEVFAYRFERRGLHTLVAWTTREQGARLSAVPVDHGRAVLYDLMGNPVPLPEGQIEVRLPLSTSPLFLEGVAASRADRGRSLTPSPNQGPPPRHPDVWLSFHYPPGSEVVSLPRGTTRRLRLRVYNDGPEPTTAELHCSPGEGPLAISPRRLQVRVPGRASRLVTVRVSAPADLPEDTYRIFVRGEVEGLSCGEMAIRCHVAEGEALLFNMVTWEMAQNLVGQSGYGQGLGVRWISAGGHLTFRFDLTEAAAARLSGYMRSSSPTVDGGTFRLSASVDGVNWSPLLEGEGALAWRDADLSSYAGEQVLVRFDNSRDKGEAILHTLLLVTSPPRPSG